MTTSKIADSAITTAKILDGTIGSADLAASAVNSASITDGSVGTGDLADQAVTIAKLAATRSTAGRSRTAASPPATSRRAP